MKTLMYVIIILQLLCFAVGIFLLTQGSIFYGLINIIINAVFIPLNIDTLRKCD